MFFRKVSDLEQRFKNIMDRGPVDPYTIPGGMRVRDCCPRCAAVYHVVVFTKGAMSGKARLACPRCLQYRREERTDGQWRGVGGSKGGGSSAQTGNRIKGFLEGN